MYVAIVSMKTDRPAAVLLKNMFHPLHPVRSKGLFDSLPILFAASENAKKSKSMCGRATKTTPIPIASAPEKQKDAFCAGS